MTQNLAKIKELLQVYHEQKTWHYTSLIEHLGAKIKKKSCKLHLGQSRIWVERNAFLAYIL